MDRVAVLGISNVEDVLSASTESITYRPLFEALSAAVPHTEAMVVTTSPRGGMHVVQPARVPEVLVRAYGEQFHMEDRCTVAAIVSQKPVTGQEAWGEAYDGCRYLRDFMLYTRNLYHVVAVPLSGLIFAGYPAAIHLYREHAMGAFTPEECATLSAVARKIDAQGETLRQARRPAQGYSQAPWSHRLPVRLFALDKSRKSVFGQAAFEKLDERLREQVLQHTQSRLALLSSGSALPADRLQMPDSHGDLWTFRVVTFESYPALGRGPVVFFCLQPEAFDWTSVRPSDFAADLEMVRLAPAVAFMQKEFFRSPTLGEIARSVHLSPFHFHRRFTELFGLTPKHFLLECQIFESKRQLMAYQKDLSEIASDCGFAHQSHFTSRFKQATGLTPTRWRRVAQDMQRSVTF